MKKTTDTTTMKISILDTLQDRFNSLKLYWQWRKTVRHTHAQRRFDQIVMLINNVTNVDRLYEIGDLAEEYELRFAQEPFNDRFARSLCHRISQKQRDLYYKLINL